MGFKNKQGGAFDNFDPQTANKFDPGVMNRATGGDAGSVQVAAKVGQKMQFNITLNNPTTQNLTFELFNYLNSMTRILNATYVVGNYKYIPFLTYEGLTAFKAATDHGGTVGFDQVGNLEIRGDTSLADPSGTISCKEIGYSGLFEASAITPFNVDFIRFTCLTNLQIDQTINWFQKSYSGGVTQNVISPRAYFKPNKFQNFTIDITVSFTIGIDQGLSTILLPSENVRLAFFVTFWTKQAIS